MPLAQAIGIDKLIVGYILRQLVEQPLPGQFPSGHDRVHKGKYLLLFGDNLRNHLSKRGEDQSCFTRIGISSFSRRASRRTRQGFHSSSRQVPCKGFSQGGNIWHPAYSRIRSALHPTLLNQATLPSSIEDKKAVCKQ